ncbi:MAG: hypothetical protein NTZ78_04075, partial [Candidatus Aureabacteria bacterium]|nr:hypothetical protein [Candidatus Auribacterota bacterium]
IFVQEDWNVLLQYSLYGLIYSSAGILQNRKFWRFALHGTQERWVKLSLVVMTVAALISGAALVLAIVMAVPKLPPDKKGIKFERGSVQYYDDWRRELFMGQLSEEQEIHGIRYPQYSWVCFERSGELFAVQLPQEGVTIDGIKCSGKEWVHFYKSGRLESANLAEDREIEGKLYMKGMHVRFDERGKLIPAE